VERVTVQDLSVPIDFYFPAGESANLTQFLAEYNKLSPFRNKERLRREQMIVKSGLQCVYWNIERQEWSKKGCSLTALDNTHIKCSCSHLSAFAIQFVTPKLTIDAPLLDNTTISAEDDTEKQLTLDDIIKWPLDKYLNNL
jgi:hypothetical protein